MKKGVEELAVSRDRERITRIVWLLKFLLPMLVLVAPTAFVVWLVDGAFENGFLGQDMDEQWSTTACLRSVRDGEEGRVEDCELYEYLPTGFSSPADLTCMASLAHLNYASSAYEGSSVIYAILLDAKADCGHSAVNSGAVASAARGIFGNSPLIEEALKKEP